eukprot:scaffold2789_cov122-Cylindrotheca_fusiformis.AAC.1
MATATIVEAGGWFANKTARNTNKKGPNLKTGRCYRAKKYALPGISSHYAAGQYSDEVLHEVQQWPEGHQGFAKQKAYDDLEANGRKVHNGDIVLDGLWGKIQDPDL